MHYCACTRREFSTSVCIASAWVSDRRLRTLIDTNIFIYREYNQVLAANLSELLRVLGQMRMEILVHPQSVEEVRNDNDAKRREVAMSKIGAYLVLESPPRADSDTEFSELIGSVLGPIGRVDVALLYALYRDAVDYLVTEDRELLRTAGRIELGNRALSIDGAVALFSKWTTNRDVPRPPALQDLPVHNLRLTDPIFFQLRKDYGEFETWFRKVSAQGRKCWVYFNQDNSIGAVLIYKLEQEPINAEPPLPEKRRLKISTLVVTNRGHKVGELFVKLAIHYAIRNECEEVYLTHLTTSNDQLVDLLASYGFRQAGMNSRGESILLKETLPSRESLRVVSPAVVSQEYYPSFCDSKKVGKYIIPIRPEYHQRLFVDYPDRQTTLGEHIGEFIVEGNTIKKAYLCNSKNRTMSRGDLILFYRSVDLRQLTSIGVVESVYRLRSLETTVKLVQRRTVYSIDEIRRMLRKPTLVILFNWHFHLPQPVSAKRLNALGIFVPQSIVKITDPQYEEIKRQSNIDRRFAFD